MLARFLKVGYLMIFDMFLERLKIGLLILKLIKMGCSQSSTGAQPKKIQRTQILQQSPSPKKKKIEQKDHFLLGHVAQSQYLFAKVSLVDRALNRLPIPVDFRPYNFSNMIEIDQKTHFISGGINYSLTEITADAFIYHCPTHTVKKVAKMNQPRYTHAAIVHNQHVYVIGGRFFGQDEEAILNFCEKYSFSKDQWIVLPKLNVKRCTCYVIKWRKELYVIGGYTGTFQRSQIIQKLNEKQHKWEILNFSLNRGIQSAFLLPSGPNQITIFGGNTNCGPTSSVSTLNLKNMSIKAHKSLKQLKTLHKSFIFQQQIFIFGGSEKLLLQIYDLKRKESQIVDLKLAEQFKTETFEVLTMSQTSLNVQQYMQNDDKYELDQKDEIILMFGTTQEPFILQINVSIPSSRIYAVPLSLKLYASAGGVNIQRLRYMIFGGIQDDSLSYVSNLAFMYDNLTKQVKKLASMTTPRYSFSYQKINNRIYVFGGGTSDVDGNLDILDDCQYYQIDNDAWKSIRNLPIPLISSMSLIYNSSPYVFGGMMIDKTRNKAIFKYDKTKDIWCELNFHLPFGIQAAFIYPYKPSSFYIFGGRLDNGDSDCIWQLTFVQGSNSQCSFYQKGTTVQKKSGLKIFKPEKQDFFVSFGGRKEIVNYYDVQTLKVMQWDGLRRLKEVFLDQIQGLNSKTMENYLAVNKQY